MSDENSVLVVTKDVVVKCSPTAEFAEAVLKPNKILLDLRTRPQILVNDNCNLLAVFLDKDSYDGIIKMIKSLKNNEDFGIIEVAKLWKQLKPFLEKMEIKTS